VANAGRSFACRAKTKPSWGLEQVTNLPAIICGYGILSVAAEYGSLPPWGTERCFGQLVQLNTDHLKNLRACHQALPRLPGEPVYRESNLALAIRRNLGRLSLAGTYHFPCSNR